MDQVNAKQVREILHRNGDVPLINVLPEEHFRKQHIPGSVNVPLEKDSFLQRVESLAGSKAAKIVVYCADSDCNASPKAARKLEEAGFENVADFAGGTEEWRAAGYSLEGQAVQA